LHFASAYRSACYVLDLLRNIVLNVLPHIGDFGDIHQVADRCVFCRDQALLLHQTTALAQQRGRPLAMLAHSSLPRLAGAVPAPSAAPSAPDWRERRMRRKFAVTRVKTSGAIRIFI